MKDLKTIPVDNNSWIKLYRRFLEWEWYDDINVCRLFIHLLLKANYKDKKWKGIIIKRGQVITGRLKLAKETGLTQQQVRTSLTKLISTNEITKLSTPQYTIITINNYDKYQTPTNKITNEQPTNNQPITTTKEYKEKNRNIDRGMDKAIPVSNSNSLKGKNKMEILLQEDTILELSKTLDIDRHTVRMEVEKMVDWLKAKGKRYKDYKAFARNWLRRVKIEKKDSDTNIKFFNKKL